MILFSIFFKLTFLRKKKGFFSSFKLTKFSNHKFFFLINCFMAIESKNSFAIKTLGGLENNLTTQKSFLIKMGIKQRAEIISRNKSFLEKTEIFYRLKRLIDKKQMGNLFKVMLIKKKGNKFNLGF